MRTIGQVLNSTPSYRTVAVPELPNVGGIGLELELESPRPFRDVAGWVRTNDGSLREGVEYVFDGPMAGQAALNAILAMGEELRVNPPDPSFRCSTHIHMDVRDLRVDELDRLFALYTMYEYALFDHCAPHRRYSNFCVPNFINDEQVRTFNRIFRRHSNPSSKVHGLAGWNKYSALNLKVTPQIGSVEFRGSHALVTSEELLGLAQRMLHLKRVVKETAVESTMDLITQARNLSLTDVFPQGLNRGYAPDRELQDICYSNAVFLAASEWSYDESAEEDHQEGAGWGAPTRRPIAPSTNEGCWVRVNQEVFSRYNIDLSILQSHPDNSTYKSLTSVLRVHQALQSIRGIEPPRLSQLMGRSVTEELLTRYSLSQLRRSFSAANVTLTDTFLANN